MKQKHDPSEFIPAPGNILRECNALVQGHFVYTSGKHGDWYVNKDALYPHPDKLDSISHMLADCVEHLIDKVQTIVSPAVGAIVLGMMVSHQLNLRGRIIHSVYAEKDGKDGFAFNRGYVSFVRGMRCLVVEDNLTTGESVKKVIHAIRANGGEVVAVAALCNRGGLTASSLEVPELISLLSINLQAWSEEDCPLCKEGVPVHTGLGKGREFLARQGAARTST